MKRCYVFNTRFFPIPRYISDPLNPTILHLSHTPTALSKQLRDVGADALFQGQELRRQLLARPGLLVFVEIAGEGNFRAGTEHGILAGQVFFFLQ